MKLKKKIQKDATSKIDDIMKAGIEETVQNINQKLAEEKQNELIGQRIESIVMEKESLMQEDSDYDTDLDWDDHEKTTRHTLNQISKEKKLEEQRQKELADKLEQEKQKKKGSKSTQDQLDLVADKQVENEPDLDNVSEVTPEDPNQDKQLDVDYLSQDKPEDPEEEDQNEHIDLV